ncbi:MAG: hypothetical protein K8I30_24220 [Anaerolineae bacterium]|nr:hypothetical protein [Anaerolineae bacterium]
MRRLLLLFFLTVLIASTAAAQDVSAPVAWKMTSAQSVQDVIGEAFSPSDWPYLSPDGSALAWDTRDDAVAIYNFDDAATMPFAYAENCCAFGRYSAPTWSPDSRYFTFTESVFDRMLESDIWMLDREGGTIVNRTDDGVFGGWLGETDPFAIDYLPTWNPANGDLYFFRSLWPKEGDRTTGLYLMPVGRDEPKLVADLTAQLPILSVYRPAVIAPDGKRIAFIVLGSELDDARNGLWVMDLKTADAEQIATVEDLRAGLPAWQTESSLFPEFMQWAGNDALVVQSRDTQFATSGVGQMAYYVAVETGEVTPLTTFEDVEGAPDLYRDDNPDSPVFRVPRSGVVTPDGGAFIFVRTGVNGSSAGVSLLPLPPDGSAPVDLGGIEDFGINPSASAPPAMGSNGRAFMFGYLFEFEDS